MSNKEFVDYYELLQLSPNADTETIERIFRHLAKKLHPDSNESGDKDLFYKIVEAHRILSNPETRAGYDARHQNYWNQKWGLASEAANACSNSAFSADRVIRDQLLSLLYVQRRRNMEDPGLGVHSVARLLNTPLELVDFHLWYLKDKGWVERLHNGLLAITALGVDQIEQSRLILNSDHMIENLKDTEKNGDINLISSGE